MIFCFNFLRRTNGKFWRKIWQGPSRWVFSRIFSAGAGAGPKNFEWKSGGNHGGSVNLVDGLEHGIWFNGHDFQLTINGHQWLY